MKMIMTIEEKVKNAEDLLRNYYLIQGIESITISSHVLEENGLGGKDFWDITCPALKKKGVLKNYSYSAESLDTPEDYAKPQRAQDLLDAIKYNRDSLDDLYKRDISWLSDVVIPGTTDNNAIVEKQIREAKEGLKELLEQYNSLELFYSFEVNADYLNKKVSQGITPAPLFALPFNAKWENITIKFKEDSESVEIFLGNKQVASSDYKKMGFGKNKPDKQWKFMQRLAAIYAANEQRKEAMDMPATVEDMALSVIKRIDEKARLKIHTIKKSLSSQLQDDFGIHNDEPFDDYNLLGYYKTKFHLKPEPSLRWSGKEGFWSAEKRFNDATSYKNDDEIGTNENDESIEDLRNNEILEGREDEA